jgi:hypothetical protein
MTALSKPFFLQVSGQFWLIADSSMLIAIARPICQLLIAKLSKIKYAPRPKALSKYSSLS